MKHAHVLLLLLAAAVGAPTAATAQVIGTFTWQTQPYCNSISVTVVQQGALFQVSGIDNLCGAGVAPVTGTAVPAGGSVVFGLTVSTPGGRAAHLSASIALASLSGTWSDADGNTGAFVFNGASGNARRPDPAAAVNITAAQLAPSVFAGSGTAPTAARSDHAHDERYFTEAETLTLVASRTLDVRTSGYPTGSATYTPEVIATSRQVTTSRAGRLDIRMGVGVNLTCTPNASAARVIYLTLDGVGLPTSTVLVMNAAGSFSGSLSAVTTASIPAGTHQIGIGLECTNADVAVNQGVSIFSAVTVVVMP